MIKKFEKRTKKKKQKKNRNTAHKNRSAGGKQKKKERKNGVNYPGFYFILFFDLFEICCFLLPPRHPCTRGEIRTATIATTIAKSRERYTIESKTKNNRKTKETKKRGKKKKKKKK